MQTAAALSFPTLVQIHSTCLMWSIASLNPLVFYACHLKKKKKKPQRRFSSGSGNYPHNVYRLMDGACMCITAQL